MMITVPFVVYAIFRYIYLIHHHEGGGSPEELVLKDKPLAWQEPQLLNKPTLRSAKSLGVTHSRAAPADSGQSSWD